MMKQIVFLRICLSGLSVMLSTCNRPTGRIPPLSDKERADVLAPSFDAGKLETRLTLLEQSVSGTATNNRLDAGDINRGITSTMRAEFTALEREWALRSEDVARRLSALRDRLYKHQPDTPQL